MSNKASLKPFKKGHDPRRNVTGANKGHRSFEADFNEVVEKIAEQNKITASEARQLLLLKGYSEAKSGNYQFWQYIHNQLYGTALQRNEISGKDGAPIEITQIVINAPHGTEDIGNKSDS